MDQSKRQFLKQKAREARIAALTGIHSFGCGHVGGSMSIIETLVVLYYEVMRIDPKNPRWELRDRFVMSKGHAAPGLYGVLACRGFFDPALLKTMNANGTILPSHCDMNKAPGVDMTAGSLGQGICTAVGMALGAKMDRKDIRVYAAVGDGECQEGSVWEAAMFAPSRRLDNLTVFLDNNKGQVDGFTKDILDVEPLADKWAAFGWDVHIVSDGHDPEQILEAIENAQKVADKPHLIMLNTIKAYGVPGFEGTDKAHFFDMGADLFEKAKRRCES